MANDLELSRKLGVADLARLYYPNSMEEERLAQTLSRQNLVRQLSGHGAPAANTATVMSTWPPRPGETVPPALVINTAKTG